MKQNKSPKFAHLQYQVLYDLEISIAEYFLLDMIYQLSRNGWCNKRLDNIAYDMNITRRGVIQMRDRLIERDLLHKGIANRLKTTEKVHKVYLIDDRRTQKSEQSSKKSVLSSIKSEQSFPKNNNRTTLDKEINNKEKGKDHRGKHSPAKERLRLKWSRSNV